MLHIEISTTPDRTERILDVVRDDVAVSSVGVMRGASVRPEGDIVVIDIAREAVSELIEELRALGVPVDGSVRIEEVDTYLSVHALEAERRAPGFGSDAVVWPQVGQRAYLESELNFTYLGFMILATVLAAIAIVLDSQVLTIGAMVLGPEFGAIAAIGVALVLRRWKLLGQALWTLVAGFVVAIVVTLLLSLLVRGIGWVERDDLRHHPETAFIYSPDRWSFIVAILAAVAGILSITSARAAALSGVFISVTTIPAAGNVGLGMAFGEWGEVRGSALQLIINITGMTVAGCLTLYVQRRLWKPFERRRVARVRDIGGPEVSD